MRGLTKAVLVEANVICAGAVPKKLGMTVVVGESFQADKLGGGSASAKARKLFVKEAYVREWKRNGNYYTI